MQKVTIDGLNGLVAQAREPMPLAHEDGTDPRDGTFSERGEWRYFVWKYVAGGGNWQPRHNYPSDMNAAMVLWDELPAGRELKHRRGASGLESYRVSWQESDDDPHRECRIGNTVSVAICLAWLAWKGIEAVMSDD